MTWTLMFARRGPLTALERQRRMSQRLCLVCGQSGHLKATCPKSNSRFGSQRHVQAIEMMTLTLRFGETTSADFKWRLRLGRENPDSEDAAHFPSVLPSASNINSQQMFQILIQTSLDPSTSIFALSSLRKLLLPGTLRIGPTSHVGTFFVDCGADDVFMDLKLAEELKDSGTWKTPAVDKILPSNPDPMEPYVQDVLDLEKSLPSGPVSTWNLDSIHSDVYPFLDASPDSNSSVPADIFKEFTSVFSKKQSEKLPIHREFDCTIDLVPNAAPHHG
ncbi:hypothetical protein BASA83_013262 [Batrachochytrium salamandrivorans]|nr:hypothetical protein BASA83_013262 [Batrachochytrium salamandrivorans]